MQNVRKHEVAFCAEVSKWADKLFESNLALPFGSSDIESFGRGSLKRQDFRVYERKAKGQGKLVLCGEIKLPGTHQGRSPFDLALIQDAFDKATAENCQFFFTWNVEHLALFDRSRWDADSMLERCVAEWKLGLELNKPTDITRPEVIEKIRDEFLPRFFTEFAEIWSGRNIDWGLPPSELFITMLESHLSGPQGPVRELRDYLADKSAHDRGFDVRLQQWMAMEQQWNFVRSDPVSWRETIDRAARSMVYVLSNRILFYQAVRLRSKLPELKLPSSAKTPQKALDYLRDCFQEAVDRTGDYEPVFFPEEKEWAALNALSGTNSIEAWDRVISTVERFNFKEIPTDILGHTFQRLIGPEERHKFGQHYTDETIVDVINAFCIRKAGAKVLDPACGSGSFLVRAYYRKHHLDKRLTNQDLLEGIYGCDINPFPAHLATLNLAARNISNEENYPRIVRKNFFTVAPGKPFCELPMAIRDQNWQRKREKIELPTLDAVIGNPPYVRHELIPKASQRGVIREQAKEYIHETVQKAWPQIDLSKQSDLHVYFWPMAAQFLADDGWLGFLTSSSWLDVRYGFALQRWILLNFCLMAVIESVDEPWFEDARVKTAVTILQRCDDEEKRHSNLVRFVRFNRPLAEILGEPADESQRQKAAEKIRDLILKTKADRSTDQLRILVKRQGDLWSEGLSVAQMFAKQKELAASELGAPDEDDEPGADEAGSRTDVVPIQGENGLAIDYGGGKWGRNLRAPDFYFEIMRDFGHRFTRLGEIANIKRGITSGCDGFFMPHNVSKRLLEENPNQMKWSTLPLMKRCKREEVASGKVAIVQCGDGTIHPIEAEYVRPEVHSLMQVDRPLVSPEQLDRVVLWVNQPLGDLKGTYVHHFITWGSTQTFQSKKSKSVPIPERSTCASRSLWYNVTGLQPGIGFWSMSQQYRHIIPANPYGLSCNHNLFDLHVLNLNSMTAPALMPILNSTLIALIKTFYGRYAGTEGNLKTEVIDVVLLEIPDPRHVTKPVLKRLEAAFVSMQKREVTHLVEDAFLDCHTTEEVREAAKRPLGLPRELRQKDRRQLDDAVFELLGVTDPHRREQLVDQLYREVTLHFRAIRSVEVQKMEQRRVSGGRSTISPMELALDAWNELEPEWQTPLETWFIERLDTNGKVVNLPEGEVRLPDAGNFFDATTLYFGKNPAVSYVCANRAEAELLFAIAREGLRGSVAIPATKEECRCLAQTIEARLNEGRKKLEQLAERRAGTDKLREQVVEILYRWFTQGKPNQMCNPQSV